MSKVLQICHEWVQEFHTEFENGDKLRFFHVYKLKHGGPRKKENTRSKVCTTDFWLRYTASSKKFEVAGSDLSTF